MLRQASPSSHLAVCVSSEILLDERVGCFGLSVCLGMERRVQLHVRFDSRVNALFEMRDEL